MPYTPHAGFHEPEDGNTRIWRYVDLPRFLDMVIHSRLAFIRTDKMADKFEGTLPKGELDLLVSQFRALGPSTVDFARMIDLLERQGQSQYAKLGRHATFLSCWHMNPNEAGAMWAIYAKQGIAIESTVDRLKAALAGDADREIHIGRVVYGDTNSLQLFEGPPKSVILYKRQLFDFERELRVVIYSNPPGLPADAPTVIYARLDLRHLINRIWVGPKQSGWFEQMFRDLLLRLDLPDINVVRSTLDDDPAGDF